MNQPADPRILRDPYTLMGKRQEQHFVSEHDVEAIEKAAAKRARKAAKRAAQMQKDVDALPK